MLLHRELEEGLRSGDDDIVDESMKCCLRVSLSATCCVDEGFDAESEELLLREVEEGFELRLEDDDDDDVDKARNCCL